MSLINIILYILCLCIFFIYIIRKYRKRAYIFSVFNIGLFIYTFNIIISPLFFTEDRSWYGLGITYAYTMKSYLNEALHINLIGYILYIIFLSICEFRNTNTKRIETFARRVSNSISNTIIDCVFLLIIVTWYAICLVYCHGLPLIYNQRTFYLNLSISPIYLFLNQIILMCTLYYSVRYALHKEKIVYMFIGIITVAFQGNRAALLTSLLLPISIIIIYQKLIDKKNKENNQHIDQYAKKKQKRKVIYKIVCVIPILMVLGLWLQFIRKGGNSSLSKIMFEFLYGNTFSDIRDGAYILKGFHETTGSLFLHGKTYLAAIMSFIPSSVSEFRSIWSWGRYTTLGLFGMTNHFGLRGGYVMEAYINFGWIGVILSALFQGMISGLLEKIFYKIFIIEEILISGREYFVFYIVYLINGVFTSSSSAYNIYSLIVFIFSLILITNVLRPKYQRSF